MSWKIVRGPNKRTYQYSVFGGDDRFDLHSNFVPESGQWLAEEAAEDFFDNHDGWESTWPIVFTIYDGENVIGSFSVDMESVPQFTALQLQT